MVRRMSTHTAPAPAPVPAEVDLARQARVWAALELARERKAG